MGSLKDILDTIDDTLMDLKSVSKDVVSTARNSKGSSLSSRASEGVLQFPVIVSSSIDIDTAQMVSKALERNYATFAQLVFSMSPTLRYHENVSGVEYLNKFHQNNPNLLDIKIDLKESVTVSLNESVDYDKFETDQYVVLSAIYEGATGTIVANNKEQAIDLMEHVRHDVLNKKYTPKSDIIYNFKDKKLNEKYNNIVTEDLAADKFKYQKEKDAKDFEYKKKQDNIRNTSTTLFKDVLKDNDVKKSNELIATTLHLTVKLVNDQNEFVGTMDFIIGIKAYMHLVKSNEMIKNMVSACVNNDKIFNFLRWTTGEISFFKDFVFNIKGIKNDISDMGRGGSHWWTTLKNRQQLAKIGSSILSKNGVIPNATIVISAEEVEYIRTEYGYDLKNKYFMDKIMKEYFLLGFVIVDSSAQLVHFLFDGDTDTQTVSFSGLEKANVNSERTFREMLKTMNRI